MNAANRFGEYQPNDYNSKPRKGSCAAHRGDDRVRSDYDELLDDDTSNRKWLDGAAGGSAANDVGSKYAKFKDAPHTDMRPPSRQKTPTKAVGLDDMSGTPTSPDSRQARAANRPDEYSDTMASLEPKGDLFRRKNIAKARRTDDGQCASVAESKQTAEYEARNTYTHGSKALKDFDLLDE